jgi:hypothetical protein
VQNGILASFLHEAETLKLFPKYLIAVLIVLIGILPQLCIKLVIHPTSLYTGASFILAQPMEFIYPLQWVSIAAAVFILLIFLLLGVKKLTKQTSIMASAPTWGCGYSGSSARFQYTANSFVRPFRKLIRPLLMMNKKEGELTGIFPNPIHSETHPYDKMVLRSTVHYGNSRVYQVVQILQNGTQFYILYGVVFILSSSPCRYLPSH